jgi:hypothetical protein
VAHVRRAAAAALGALLLGGCFSLGAAQRRAQLEALLAEPGVPVVFDEHVGLAFVRVEDALTFSSGFEAGERLRAQFALSRPRSWRRSSSTPRVTGWLRAGPRRSSSRAPAAGVCTTTSRCAATG